MKWFKYFLTVTLLSLGFNAFANETTVFAEESVGNSEVLTFDQLSNEDKKIFLDNGFTEEDTFYKDNITMPNDDSRASTKAIVASVVGSTKKEASNRAKTTYSIKSSTVMNIVDVQTTASGSGVKRISSNTTKPNAKAAVISTTTEYSGAATYFTFKGNTQITTPKGVAGTVFSTTAGGATLGY